MYHAYLDAVKCFKELQELLSAWVRVGEAGTLGTQLNLSAKFLASPCAGHGQRATSSLAVVTWFPGSHGPI